VLLQRLFSTFPGGLPGIGLLLLRASVGGLAVICGALYFFDAAERTPAVWIMAAGLLVSGATLIVGYLTPLASLLTGLCIFVNVCSWVPTHLLASLGARLMAAVMVLIAVAIALLGPGAFSLDGYLFGRREIVIPPRTPES